MNKLINGSSQHLNMKPREFIHWWDYHSIPEVKRQSWIYCLLSKGQLCWLGSFSEQSRLLILYRDLGKHGLQGLADFQKIWSVVDAQYYISYRCTIQWFTIFTGYIPFRVIGYIPCVAQYTLVAYFVHNSLCLLILYPYIALPPSLSPLVTTRFFSVSESTSVLFYSLVCCIFRFYM